MVDDNFYTGILQDLGISDAQQDLLGLLYSLDKLKNLRVIHHSGTFSPFEGQNHVCILTVGAIMAKKIQTHDAFVHYLLSKGLEEEISIPNSVLEVGEKNFKWIYTRFTLPDNSKIYLNAVPDNFPAFNFINATRYDAPDIHIYPEKLRYYHRILNR